MVLRVIECLERKFNDFLKNGQKIFCMKIDTEIRNNMMNNPIIPMMRGIIQKYDFNTYVLILQIKEYHFIVFVFLVL